MTDTEYPATSGTVFIHAADGEAVEPAPGSSFTLDSGLVLLCLTQDNFNTMQGEVPYEDGNFVRHAKRELDLAGEDDDITAWMVGVVREFARYGHSGGSIGPCMAMLNQLLKFKPLTPLTDDPDEWLHHGEEAWGGAGGIWQSMRDPEAFSTDGGATYYLLSEREAVGVDLTPYHKSEEKVK